MNNLIIRVCEIALGSLTELQLDAERKYREEMDEITGISNAAQGAINRTRYEYDQKYEILEGRKKDVKTLMDVAYIANLSKCMKK